MPVFRSFFYLAIVLIINQVVFANSFSLADNGDETWNVHYISAEDIAGFHPEELANDFPSVLKQREEKEKIFQAMKDFELNPWKYTD